MFKGLIGLFKRKLIGIPVLFILVAIAIWAGYRVGWTEFNEQSLWDWMQLLIIPGVLGVGALLFNRAGQKAESLRAIDKQRQETLMTYFDRMQDLLLRGLSKSEEDSELRIVARARTLSTFSSLDGERKKEALRFLYEGDLIKYENPVLNLKGARLEGSHLNGADLWEVNLEGAHLEEAHLMGADLRGAYLEGAILEGANLETAILAGANLWEANLMGTNLRQAFIQSVVYRNGTTARWRKTHPGADISWAYVKQTDLKKETSLKAASLEWAYLQKADLNWAYLIGVDLKHAHLKGAHLRGAQLEQANLKSADLRGAYLEGAILEGAHLEEAQLDRAHLGKRSLGGERTLLRWAHLKKASLWNANLKSADLLGAHLEEARLWNANLKMANLEGANLEKADLHGANLEKANLREANLERTNLEKTNLKKADLTNATVAPEQLAQARSLKDVTLPDGTKYEVWVARGKPDWNLSK